MSHSHCEPSRAGAVLAIIEHALTRSPANAALSHFPSLRAQTRCLNTDFSAALDQTDALVEAWSKELLDDTSVSNQMHQPGSDLGPFRTILPILVRNFQQVTRRLLSVAAPASLASKQEELDRVAIKQDDFIDLGTVTRQFVDSLVETGYEIVSLKAERFNYKFLESLTSFAPVAPPSMHQTLYSDDLQRVMNDFSSMSGRARAGRGHQHSEFSCDEHPTFGDKVDYLIEKVGGDNLQHNIKAVFKFCSDFVHLGYASAVALGTADAPQIIIGVGDLYTASAENLSELRLRLLRECAHYYKRIFIPSFVVAVEQTLRSPETTSNQLTKVAEVLSHSFGLEDRKLVEFIRDGMIDSDALIHIECGRCGHLLQWVPPHMEWTCFCDGCGARFQVEVVPEAADYIVSSEGESTVNGGDAPDLDKLPPELIDKLHCIQGQHLRARDGEPLPYLVITDLEHVNVDTLEVDSRCVSRPGPDLDGHFELVAYVANKALSRDAKIKIVCACGASVIYDTARNDNFCRCGACDRGIGIWGLSGDATQLEMRESPDGPPRSVPIFGARTTTVRGLQRS